MDRGDLRADLENRFTFHPAVNIEQKQKYENVRSLLLGVADELVDLVPVNCRELSTAITKLEEAMFWTNAAIARHDDEGNRL